MHEIVLYNIFKNYGRKNIIKDFNQKFMSGRLYIFTGENGSGKSTLLKIIAGITKADRGVIVNFGNVSYLPEVSEFPRNCRTFEYLYLLKKLYRNKIINIKDIIAKWQIPNKKIGKCSKGNKQKLAIIGTILKQADSYLFDEPTDALDDLMQNNFLSLVEELIKNDKLIVIITHSPQLFKIFDYEEIAF